MAIPILAIVVALPLSLGALALFFEHRQKMLKLQIELMSAKRQGNDGELEALRAEVRSMRDTTSQYDLSFDSALQRMERRMERLEQRSFGAGEDTVEVRGIGR